MRGVAWLVPAIAITACGSGHMLAHEPDVLVQETSRTCPVLESRDWWAAIEQGDPKQLTITGVVTLPTPGYTFSWKLGVADRSMQPRAVYHLTATAPQGMVTQVLSDDTVVYRGLALTDAYRAVVVMCGDQILAEIQEVRIQSGP